MAVGLARYAEGGVSLGQRPHLGLAGVRWSRGRPAANALGLLACLELLGGTAALELRRSTGCPVGTAHQLATLTLAR